MRESVAAGHAKRGRLAASARPQHETQLSTLRTELQRLQSLLRLRQLSADAKLLEKQFAKIDQASAQLATLLATKAKLPAITAAKVRKLEGLLRERSSAGSAVRVEPGAKVAKPSTARGGARGPRPLPPQDKPAE